MLSLHYGPDYERRRTDLYNSGLISETRYYFGSGSERHEDLTTNTTRDLFYIPGPDGVAAIINIENGNEQVYFPYADHLGSITALTDVNGTVVCRQAFDPWGRRRNPISLVTDDNALPAGYSWLRGFTGHEHLPHFKLINMNARLYDPLLGRMLSPDIFVSNTSDPMTYNLYSYANNNPISYVDPDGNFIQFFLDLQYRIQKLISPVAFKLNLDFGTHGTGIGVEGSVGIPQLSFASYRYEAGASYYLDRVGGYGAGWQVRNGGEWSALGLARYGGMRYRDYNSDGLQADQVVHTASYGIPLLEASYSNDTKNSFPWADYVPLIPKLRSGSVYGQSDGGRTASGFVRAGIIEFGFFLHTGQSSYLGYDADGNLSQLGGSMGEKGLSNGIIYFGFGGLKIGWDQESIRHFIQNRVAHDGNGNPFKWRGILNGSIPNHNNGSNYWPWVPLEDRRNRMVYQFGGF